MLFSLNIALQRELSSQEESAMGRNNMNLTDVAFWRETQMTEGSDWRLRTIISIIPVALIILTLCWTFELFRCFKNSPDA
jgi:hypothetical protein